MKFGIAYICVLAFIVKSQPHKWHIWFLPIHSPTLKNQKSHFFANTRRKNRNFEKKKNADDII